MDTRRPRHLLPLLTTNNMDQLQRTLQPSSWITSPLSSGYGTEPSSPFTPTDSTWPSSLPWDDTNQNDQLDNHCCSLINPIWKNLPSDRHPEKSSTTTATIGEPAIRRIGPSSSRIWRDYSSPAVKRAIVTLDTELIAPEDIPHHPLDRDAKDIFARKPWGIATNTRTEQIYLTDRQCHVILVFGPDAEYHGKIGGPGDTAGLMNRPTGIAYDSTNDRILVVDKDNHRIQAFCATTRNFLFAFGSQGRRPGQFNFPWGIAVSQDGSRIAVTDSRNRRVQLFSSDGTFVCVLRIDVSEFDQRHSRSVNSYPRGIVFNNAGDALFVTDFRLHRIYRIDITSRRVDTIVDNQLLKRPSGIDVDHYGNILVADTRHHLIKVFRPTGQPVGVIKTIGGSPLDLPLDLSFMPAGHIAALDLNGRVRLF